MILKERERKKEKEVEKKSSLSERSTTAERFDVLCDDSIKWLQKQKDKSLCNVATGVPDMNEVNLPLQKYLLFFRNVVKLIFQKTDPDGYCIFVQTDRKVDKTLIDKSYLITDEAYKCGFKCIFHKIIMTRPADSTDLFRPTYSHILGYTISGKTGRQSPDVISYTQKSKLYENGTPLKACGFIASFLKSTYIKQKLKHKSKINKSCKTCTYDVVDPFCGRATIGIYCLKENISYLGIDINEEQCIISRKNLNNQIQLLL